ncbi:plasmid transfer protein TraA [Kitasatospora sp. NPDC001547]|uniref:plasmid transfer protein TraA n=1 Tax=Kitasatospora sp. NPDC001547 TaxID=3364015 RepID=UPI0036BBC772
MSTPPGNPSSPFPPPRRSGNNGGAGGGKTPPPPPGGGNSRTRVGPSYHFNYTRNTTGGGGGGAAYGGRGPGGPGPAAGGIGSPAGGGRGAGGGAAYSPLGDPEFFTNADVRNYCEQGRSAMSRVSFDLAMAYELLSAVLKEVPDADGRPFGSLTRARRVAKHLKKAADDAKDCAAEIARTYAAFQREYDPEISRVAQPRRQPRRKFEFGG